MLWYSTDLKNGLFLRDISVVVRRWLWGRGEVVLTDEKSGGRAA